jgi:hypothetical protein
MESRSNTIHKIGILKEKNNEALSNKKEGSLIKKETSRSLRLSILLK